MNEIVCGFQYFAFFASQRHLHLMAHPARDTLTPGNIAKDFLAIADAEGAQRFAYYGYSWLALSGLQLAIRTDRLWALIMGGYPPVDGPYSEMLKVTRATHEMTIHPEKAAAANPDSEWDMNNIPLSLFCPKARLDNS